MVDAPSGGGQDTLGEHVARAVEALLAGLEHEHDVAGEVVAVGAEQPCGPGQRRGVQVVPAGVHGAGPRGEVLAGALGDRETVHVAAQQDHRGVRAGARGGAAQDGGDRRRRRPLGDLQREPLHRGQYPVPGPGQGQPDLGVTVQLPAQVHQVRLQRPGVVTKIHKRPLGSYRRATLPAGGPARVSEPARYGT